MVNVATPDDAVAVVVPPSVPFEPLAIVAVTEVELSLVTVLSYESRRVTTGCCANRPPGAPPEGCVVTLKDAGDPAATLNPDDVPVSEPPDVRVADRVLFDPAVMTVTECDARTPDANAAVVPEPDEIVVFDDDTSTVPVKFATVRPPASLAVIFTANDDPAVCDPIAPPPAASTVNDASGPYAVTADDASELAPDRVEFDAATLNSTVEPAVTPVTVHEVDVEDEAVVHVPEVGEVYAPPSTDRVTL